MAIPTEHGGWSLTAEPAVLGLIVAWSGAGLALAVGAMVAFVARTPLKVVLVDRHRGRWLPRTGLAARIAAVELTVLVGLALIAIVGANGPFWVPLLVAAPLIGLELWYDMRSRSRRLIPELAGTIGIGSVAAAIALAGGAGTTVAVGLWLVVAARSVAAIPHVRAQVVRARGSEAAAWPSDLAQIGAVGVTLVGLALGWIPVAAVVVIGLMAVVHLVALRLKPLPVVAIGIQQMAIGLAVVLTTGLAMVAP